MNIPDGLPDDVAGRLALLSLFVRLPEQVFKQAEAFARLHGALIYDERTMSPQQRQNFFKMIGLLQIQSYPDRWRGIDMGHLAHQLRWSYVLELLRGPQPPHPSMWDWLTQPPQAWVRRQRHATPNEITGDELKERLGLPDGWPTEHDAPITDLEASRLKQAFMQELLDEARTETDAAGPVVGPFILMPPFKRFEDSGPIKVFVHPEGVYASLWGQPFASVNAPIEAVPTIYYLGGREQAIGNRHHIAGGIDTYLLLAGIWRDACVVRHKLYVERERERYKPSSKAAKRAQHDNPLRLPRQIPIVEYADDTVEREGNRRAAHAVRGHYRWLYRPVSDDAKEAAASRAEDYGYPAPPDGYTFVMPHLRGNDEGDLPGEYVVYAPPKRVICRGLHVLKSLLD